MWIVQEVCEDHTVTTVGFYKDYLWMKQGSYKCLCEDYIGVWFMQGSSC